MSQLNTNFIKSYFTKSASLVFAMYNGAPTLAVFLRGQTDKKSLINLTLSGAGCMLLKRNLLEIKKQGPGISLPYIHRYTPKDGDGKPKTLATVNIFKDDKNKIGIEVTNALSSKSETFFLFPPSNFSAGENSFELSQHCEIDHLATMIGMMATWAPVISPREKNNGNNNNRSNNNNNSNSSNNNNNTSSGGYDDSFDLLN